MTKLLVVVALLLCLGVLNGQTLPTMSKSFQTVIQGTLPNKNRTMSLFEHYDYDKNMFQIDTYLESDWKSKVYDLNKQVMYEIHPRDGCTATPIANETFFFTDENHHLVTTSKLFGIGSEFNNTYYGRVDYNGIWCDRWDRNTSAQLPDNTTIETTLQHYFAVPSWEIYGGLHNASNEVIVATTVQSKRIYANGTTIPFDGVFNYAFFSGDIPDSRTFDIVSYYRCPDINAGRDVPTLPRAWETAVESTSRITNSTVQFYEYFDLDRSRFSIESFEESSTSAIYSKDNIYYVIRNNSCAVHRGNSSYLTIASSSFYHLWSPASSVYMGNRVIRGIDCEHWEIPISNHAGNFTYGLYFAANNWEMRVNGENITKIPIYATAKGVDKDGNPLDQAISFFHFVPGTPHDKHFEPQHRYECLMLDQPPIPKLPSRFSTVARVSTSAINPEPSAARNQTGVYKVYFDYALGNERVDITFDDYSVSLTRRTKVDHPHLVNITNSRCEVSDLQDLPPDSDTSIWSFHNRILYNASYVFDFGVPGQNISYLGRRQLGNLPADAWLVHEEKMRNGRMIHIHIVYYFAPAGYPLPYHHGNSAIPLFAHFKTESMHTTGPNSVYESLVSFTLVDTGPIDESVWFPTKGRYCKGIDKPLPTIPNTFSMTVQGSLKGIPEVFEAKQWVDYRGNRVRVDTYDGQVTTTSLYFYNSNTSFQFNGSQSICTNDRIDDTSSIVDGHVRKANDLFGFVDNTNVSYIGVMSARGIPCDVWSHVTYKSGCGGMCVTNLRLFYSQSGYKVGRSGNHRVPIMLEIAVNDLGGKSIFFEDLSIIGFNVWDVTESTFRIPRSCPTSDSRQPFLERHLILLLVVIAAVIFTSIIIAAITTAIVGVVIKKYYSQAIEDVAQTVKEKVDDVHPL